jgi:glycosyltransferase involved in cell wall biosynthesis
VLAAIAEYGLAGVVDAPGFVDEDVIENGLAGALCLLLPSRREGYGLVVVETLSKGTPVVLVRGEDNASTELLTEGGNGFIAPSARADDLAAAITRVHRGGQQLRASVLTSFKRDAARLSLQRSLETLSAAYSD